MTHGRSVFGGPTMLTTMTEEDWTIALKVFEASRSRRGDKGRNDRKFLEALQYFVVHNITWRALPEKFGHWNSVWKRFWRLSRSGTFEAFFDALAAMSETAHLVQMFDSTVVRAHVSAAGAKGGSTIRRSGARVAASLPRITWRPISVACQLPFISLVVRLATAATSRRFSTSAPISIRAPRSATRATIPNQTARLHANAEYARQSRIDQTPKTCPPSFRKFFTRAALVSSKQSASSSASSVSHFDAKRRSGITARSSRLLSASS